MKVCYLARSKEFYFYRWYEFFIGKGHEVHVISGNDSHVSCDMDKPKGVMFHYLPEIRLKNPTANFLYNLIRLPLIINTLNRLLKKISPDVIQAHQITPSGFWASLIKFHPFIMTPMGSDVLVHARKNFIYGLITRFVLKTSDLITVDSKILQEVVIDFGGSPKKVHIIQNGVDLSIFNPNLDKIKIRKRLALENSPIILSTRGINPLYNINCIVRALHRILQSFPTAQLLFLYPFFDKDYLFTIKTMVMELGVSNSVKFIGIVDIKEMPFYYATSDVVVSLPSSDSSPCSVYESMACGTPVIMSDLPWTKYFMKNGYNAIIVPTKDEALLADSIINLLKDNNLRDRIIKNSLATVNKYVDYQKNMELMEKLSYELVENK